MNIIEKVNNREIVPRHNNYMEVTVDAAGRGPVVSFEGVHARNSGLPGLSPLKQAWLDNVQKGLDVAGWTPGWGAFADLGNVVISGGRGLYSLAKGDIEEAKRHGKNALWSTAYAVPGLEYGAKGAKGLMKLMPTGKVLNPVKSFKQRPIVAGLETGAGGLQAYNEDFDKNVKYNQQPFTKQDIKDGFNWAKENWPNFNTTETYSIDGREVDKQEFDEYSEKMKNKSTITINGEKQNDNKKKKDTVNVNNPSGGVSKKPSYGQGWKDAWKQDKK